MLLVLGLVAIFAGLVVMLSTIGVLTAERQSVSRSLAAIAALQSVPRALRERELERPFAERVLGPLVEKMNAIGRGLTFGDRLQRIQRRLDLAGNPPGWDADRMVGMKVIAAVAGAGVGAAVPIVLGAGALPTMGFLSLSAVVGWFAPSLWLYQVGYERSQRIQRDLPEALDLLTISVEAGLGFDAALAQVARHTQGPVALEFARVLQEMQIGTGRSDAMRAMGDRTDVAELRTFVGAMVQADSFGVPVADVLRVQSHEMRVKRSQRAEEQAQKVPVKIIFPLILCIMPALFVVVMGPAAINVVHVFFGGR